MNTMHKGRSRLRGFTLVELLVVVAMIVVLVSMLLPSIKKGSDSAKVAACSARLRNIATGLHLHNADKGYYPLSTILVPPTYGNQAANITWAEQLYPYMFSSPMPTRTEQCGPEFSDPAVKLGYGAQSKLNYQAYEDVCIRHVNIPEPAVGLSLTAVQAPAEMLFAADARASGHAFITANSHTLRSPDTMLNPNPMFSAIRPHNLKNNFLLCDGHVRTMNVYDTFGEGGTPNNPRWIWTLDPDD